MPSSLAPSLGSKPRWPVWLAGGRREQRQGCGTPRGPQADSRTCEEDARAKQRRQDGSWRALPAQRQDILGAAAAVFSGEVAGQRGGWGEERALTAVWQDARGGQRLSGAVTGSDLRLLSRGLLGDGPAGDSRQGSWSVARQEAAGTGPLPECWGGWEAAAGTLPPPRPGAPGPPRPGCFSKSPHTGFNGLWWQ